MAKAKRRTPAGDPSYVQLELPPDFPELLDDDSPALDGLAGETINVIAKYTEPLREQLLIQFLSAWGNLIGAKAYVSEAGTKHTARLNVLLVGPSSESAKGQSWDYILNVLSEVDSFWVERIQEGGIASGEGLIDLAAELQDTGAVNLDSLQRKLSPAEFAAVKDVALDRGVPESPGLLVFEEEFAKILRTMGRKDNILADTIKQAFGRGNLSNIRSTARGKERRVTARDTHITFICHITPRDLNDYLRSTDIGNGFSGRFLFVTSHRRQSVSRALPFLESKEMTGNLIPRLLKARDFAKEEIAEVKFSEEAGELYDEVYEDLRRPRPGPAGEVLSRGAPMVLRLSLVYAMLDTSISIEKRHLLAALDIWDYVERSAKYIFRFKETTGNSDLDLLMPHLRGAGRRGLTGKERWEIVANKGLTASRMDSAGWYGERMDILVIKTRSPKNGRGRPQKVWVLKEFLNVKAD